MNRSESPLRIRLLAACALLLSCTAAAAQNESRPAPKPKVVILGASVSNGFASGPFLAMQTPRGQDSRERSEKFLGVELSEDEYKRRTRGLSLQRLLRSFLRRDGFELRDYSNSLFFQNPQKAGASQAKSAARREPDLVIGADFLFWYVYGPRWVVMEKGSEQSREEAQRAREKRKLEMGLELVEKQLLPTGATIVLGTIPHMARCDPRILSPSWIPPKSSIDWANGVIREFAKKHASVLLYPLADRAERMRSGNFELALGEEKRNADVAGLLQVDLLHTTRLGSVVLAHDLLQWVAAELPKGHACKGLGAITFEELVGRAGVKEAWSRLPALEAAGK